MRRRTLLLAAIAALAATPASAHPQKAAITQVLFNPRTNHIEVAHRFTLHDAEAAAFDEKGARRDLLVSATAQSEFAAYVASTFQMAHLEGGDIPLTLLGAQIEGGSIWVYQDAPTPEKLSGLRIQNAALRDVWPQQTNRVNIERNGQVQTLVFSGAATELWVQFPDLEPTSP